MISLRSRHQQRDRTMHALKVSHNILDNACAWMHSARREALAVIVSAAIKERRLSVTGLGRAIDSDSMEKHCIKRSDRLIGSKHLYHEFQDVYRSFSLIILGTVQRPVILVDWSDLDPYKRHFLLRASVAVDGRALTLYEEVHELSTKEKPKAHRAFLNKLKAMLPNGCHPIIVSDAGFRTPWFKMVAKLGWDWVGRLRNRHLVRTSEDEAWFHCKALYEHASTTPKYLGMMALTKRSPTTCHFVLYKGKPKGRSKITCDGKRARSAHSEQCAKREREPWLLVTSLPVTLKLEKKVVNIYSTRMQIEESFRDVKSIR
ncbi:MAG: IS4 family transposase [Gammaproteobacteria bacterium]|nr:IS4 family transposase [Gammaproteobacteria bacterium]